jgi:murein L,D-transpeptidase YafK
MKWFIILLIISQTVMTQTFKEQQLKFPRVRSAFDEKQENMLRLLTATKVDPKAFTIFLRAYKSEQRLEVWAKNRSEKKHVLITSYPFCASSGVPGPKRQEGDGQIPEGIYYIRHFNPVSSFHLSLGINYPNASDAILGVKGISAERSTSTGIVSRSDVSRSLMNSSKSSMCLPWKHAAAGRKRSRSISFRSW